MPEGLRQVIRHRVARLAEPARRALGVGALAGPSFTLALLEGVLRDQAGLLDALDQCISAGLLTEAGPGEYAFAHALVRQTIYDEHTSSRRMRLHRRLGEAIEAGADPDAHAEALAYHFAEAAADGQAAKAAAYALAAGRNATLRLAYEDAAAHYERGLQALQLTPSPDEERRGELLLALGVTRWRSGDMERAREACRQAAELAERRREPEQFARAALAYAGPLRFDQAAAMTGPLMDLLERALEALGEGESALRARVMARLAFELTFYAPERRRPALAQQALDLVRRVGDRSELADVLTSTHYATRAPDNLDEQLAKDRELGRVAAELRDAGRVALASNWIITALLEQGAIHEARREFAALNRAASVLPQPATKFIVAVARARNAHLEGRLGDYEALAREILACGVQGEDDNVAFAYAAQMVVLRREQGRLGELLGTIEGLVNRSTRFPGWRSALSLVYAELDRRPDAQRELEAVARDDFSAIPRDWFWLVTIAVLSEVAAYLDDAPRAERLHELLLPYADRCVVADSPCLGSASRPLGLLATTIGNFNAAARHFADALELNTRIESPLWVAHTQHDYARMLLRRDHPGDRKHALVSRRRRARHGRQARADGVGRQSSATQAPGGSRPFRVRKPRMTHG